MVWLRLQLRVIYIYIHHVETVKAKHENINYELLLISSGNSVSFIKYLDIFQSPLKVTVKRGHLMKALSVLFPESHSYIRNSRSYRKKKDYNHQHSLFMLGHHMVSLNSTAATNLDCDLPVMKMKT